MNIFVLDLDPAQCAQAHADRHISKMILESAQMLCTVAHAVGVANVPYRPTHANHPCTKWLGESVANVDWVWQLCEELNLEKQIRFFSGFHKSLDVVREMRKALRFALPDIPRTPFAQAMPEHLRHSDPVVAYRAYYREAKRHLHRWTRRGAPTWLNDNDL